MILALGALCWLIGNLAWTGISLIAAVPWWLAFLVLTIAGERLELTRFLPTPLAAQCVFGATFSAALLALAVWLLRHDIARRNARQQGLPRFIALCLLKRLCLAGRGRPARYRGWIFARPSVA